MKSAPRRTEREPDAPLPGWITIREGSVDVRVRVVPRASRSELVDGGGDTLKVRVKASPVDGRANREVLELLAASAGIPTRDATLVSGAAARSKTVRLASASPRGLAATLAASARLR